MKNLLNLGKALNKAEQKEIFGGGNFDGGGGNKFTDVGESAGGGDGESGDNGFCTSDADCSNMPHWATNGNSDCSEGDWTCGHWTNTAQGTCTQVSAGGQSICIA